MLPVYQLTVSVTVASSTLIVAERTSGQDFRSNYKLPNIRRAKKGAEEPTTAEEDTAEVVSLSLGKSDIKAALERYYCSPVLISYIARAKRVCRQNYPASQTEEYGKELASLGTWQP